MDLTATFNSVNIELPFTGESRPGGPVAAATMRYSTDGGSNWTVGLPLWRESNQWYVNNSGSLVQYSTAPSEPYNAFVGAVLGCTPNTTYTVEVTTTGVSGAGVTTDSITTRAENIIAASSLTPTHTLAASGGDFATVAAAAAHFNSNGGNILVGCAPGHFTVRGVTINSGVNGTLTFVAQNPAVDDNQNEINLGSRTVFTYNEVTTPGTAAWEEVEFDAPNSSAKYKVWKYTASARVNYLGYAETADAEPQRIGEWKLTGVYDDTDEHAVEFLYEADTYNYGWLRSMQGSSGSANSPITYVRMPPNAPSSDPNDLYMTIGVGTLITSRANGTPVNGSVVRFSGIEFRAATRGIDIVYPAHHHVIDHCLFSALRFPINFSAQSSPSIQFGYDDVIEHCVFRDSNMRRLPGQSGTGMIPWPWIKGKSYRISQASGNPENARTGEFNEGTGISGSGAARRTIVRYCLFDGVFNGHGTVPSTSFGRYAGAEHEVHHCTFRNIPDDCFGENEPFLFNFKAHHNSCEYISVMMSTADGRYGPQYIYRNRIWRWGSEEVIPTNRGPDDKGVTPVMFKTSGGNLPTNRIYFVHNTAWTDRSSSISLGRPRVLQNTNTGTGTRPDHYWRNNILVATGALSRVVWDATHVWDEDYDAMAAPAGSNYGIVGSSDNTYTSISAYRTASGDGTNTNKVGVGGADVNLNDVTAISGLLVDPANGDLRLADDSMAIGAGVFVPMLTGDFDGAAPDLGYLEFGGEETPDILAAPLGLSAVTVSDSQIDLAWTDASDNEDGFIVEESSDGGLNWTAIAELAANTETYERTGLPAGVTRHYRVRAFRDEV